MNITGTSIWDGTSLFTSRKIKKLQKSELIKPNKMKEENKSTFVVVTSENKQNEQEKQKYIVVAKPDTGKLYFLSSEVLPDWIVSTVSDYNSKQIDQLLPLVVSRAAARWDIIWQNSETHFTCVFFLPTFERFLQMREKSSQALKVKVIHLPVVEQLRGDVRVWRKHKWVNDMTFNYNFSALIYVSCQGNISHFHLLQVFYLHILFCIYLHVIVIWIVLYFRFILMIKNILNIIFLWSLFCNLSSQI